MSHHTKLYFDLENSSSLLEGGAKTSKKDKKKSSSKKGIKIKPTPVPAEDMSGFVQKVYGLFSFQVATQLIYVLLLSQTEQKGGLHDFAKSWYTLAAGLVLTIIATVVVVMAKGNGSVPASKGYACWLLQTIGLSLVAGFIAAKKDPKTILAAEIATIVVTMVCTLFGGKLLDFTGQKGTAKNLGGTFAILSLVLATVMIASSALGIAGMKSKLILSLILVVMILFFIIDTYLIVSGTYTAMTKEDYIYGSMKLFADFILIFGLLANLMGE